MGPGKQGDRAECFPETYRLGRLVLLLESSFMAICLHSAIKWDVTLYALTEALASLVNYTLCCPAACTAFCPFMK